MGVWNQHAARFNIFFTQPVLCGVLLFSIGLLSPYSLESIHWRWGNSKSANETALKKLDNRSQWIYPMKFNLNKTRNIEIVCKFYRMHCSQRPFQNCSVLQSGQILRWFWRNHLITFEIVISLEWYGYIYEWTAILQKLFNPFKFDGKFVLSLFHPWLPEAWINLNLSIER